MTDRPPQITVLDAGGQYCHLIARRVRELGVYAEVQPSETPLAALTGRKGIIISGGPSSVYEPGSPTIDPRVLNGEGAVLGICYGQQLMAYLLGGNVQKGQKGEYGLARLELQERNGLFQGVGDNQQVWMNHRDLVAAVPAGFSVLGRTATCAIAAMGNPGRRQYSVQFHPEVVHTRQGTQILSNFVFGICGCEKDWDHRDRLRAVEQQIRQAAGNRNVFFFASGGVDSTVACTLCVRALGPDRVRATYVDTGLMREGETEFVQSIFASMGEKLDVEPAADLFLGALEGVRDPERKRHIIGEKFVDVQEGILARGPYLDGHWILGQGTIYPDTIESGGTARADVIKTHHNRVAGIQKLIDAGRIVEPLSSFYKDEVREIGRDIGLPGELLDRHPFPGPGLAIRCLCADSQEPLRREQDGWILPVRSVGVQGDSRSYRSVLVLEEHPSLTSDLDERVPELTNRIAGINRVVSLVATHAPLGSMRSHRCSLSVERLERLRRADAIVRRLCEARGFTHAVWQFPVVLIPVGTPDSPDSVVLRPIGSVDGMTAHAVLMPSELLAEMSKELLQQPGICAVFYDLTNKPPATIEWE